MIITSGLTNQASASTATEITLGSCATEIDSGAFAYCSGITEIEIPDSVTRIGNSSSTVNCYNICGAFQGCQSLSSVTIGSGITQIGSNTFSGCTNIINLRINASTPPYLGECPYDTFRGSYLIYVPQESYDSYVSGSSWGYYSSRIAYDGIEYQLRYFDNDNVPIAISLCTNDGSLNSVNVPSGAVSVELGNCITSIGNTVFRDYNSLRYTDLPSGITHIGAGAFANAGSFSSLTIPSGATYVGGGAFRNDTIGILNYNTNLEDTRYVSGIFSGSTIDTVNIGDNVTYLPSTMFSGSSINTITVPSGVTEIGNYIFKNSHISSITYSAIDASGYSANYLFENAEIKRMNSYTDGVINIPDSMKYIKAGSFRNTSGYTEINFPNTVETINAYAFENCNTFSSVTLSSGVTTIGRDAFKNTSVKTFNIIGNSATTFDLGSLATSSLTDIHIDNASGFVVNNYDSCFMQGNKNNVEKLYLGSGVTSVVNRMCGEWSKLKDLTLSEGLQTIGDMAFYRAFDSTVKPNITIPNSVTSIGASAFSYSNISEMQLPNSLSGISSNTFYSSTITNVNLPSTLKTIGDYAFYYCSNLEIDLTIPNGVTSIGVNAFSISGIKSLTIPSSVLSIGNGAFSYCRGLSSIIINRNTPPTIGTQVFDGSSCLIYVPQSSYDIYINAENWSNYASRIYGIGMDYKAMIIGGSPKVVACNGIPSITKQEVGSVSSANTIVIGNCITSIDASAFTSVRGATSVALSSGITTVGDGAFSSMTLTSLTLSDSLTTIGRSAFKIDINQINELTLPSGVTSIGNYAISDNYAGSGSLNVTLTSLVPPTIVTNGNENPQPFGSRLNTVYVPCQSYNDYVSAWTEAFPSEYQREYLVDKLVPYGEYSKDEEVVGEYFCENGNKYKKMAHYISSDNNTWCFIEYRMGSLIESGSPDCQIRLYVEYKPNYGTEYEPYIDYCSNSSTTVTANEIDSISHNDWISSLTIGDCVTEIGSGAVRYHTSISSITLSDNIETIGTRAFEHCTNIKTITLPSRLVTISNRAFNECSGLTSVAMPSGLTSIGDYAFSGCSSISSITIPDSVSVIGQNAFAQALVGSLHIENAEIGRAAFWSSGIQNVTFGSGVTIGSDAFMYSNIENVTLPSGVTLSSGSEFWGCNITAATIDTNTSRFTFGDCLSLVSVTLGDNITSIGYGTFAYCSSLTSIIIPSGVTFIGGSAFDSCSSLSSITVNAITPPTLEYGTFNGTNNCPIYVPSESLETYRAANRWSEYADRLFAIPS